MFFCLCYGIIQPDNKGGGILSKTEQQALQSAAASSAMEGLALEAKHLQVVECILDGKLSLQEYLHSLKIKEA